VTLIIAGTVRTPPENLAGLKPHMLAMLAASRAEDGCLTYSYAEDVAEPGLIRVYEVWRDQAALEPIYEELEGWSESTAGARSWKDLPANAVKYVRRIEELIGAPAAMVSTSPQRDDTIMMRDPFQD